jgi:hypothetical protein
MATFAIAGSAYRRAHGVNRAILYTASECVGCGESATYAALRFVDGPADPPPIVITRES